MSHLTFVVVTLLALLATIGEAGTRTMGISGLPDGFGGAFPIYDDELGFRGYFCAQKTAFSKAITPTLTCPDGQMTMLDKVPAGNITDLEEWLSFSDSSFKSRVWTVEVVPNATGCDDVMAVRCGTPELTLDTETPRMPIVRSTLSGMSFCADDLPSLLKDPFFQAALEERYGKGGTTLIRLEHGDTVPLRVVAAQYPVLDFATWVDSSLGILTILCNTGVIGAVVPTSDNFVALPWLRPRIGGGPSYVALDTPDVALCARSTDQFALSWAHKLCGVAENKTNVPTIRTAPAATTTATKYRAFRPGINTVGVTLNEVVQATDPIATCDRIVTVDCSQTGCAPGLTFPTPTAANPAVRVGNAGVPTTMTICASTPSLLFIAMAQCKNFQGIPYFASKKLPPADNTGDYSVTWNAPADPDLFNDLCMANGCGHPGCDTALVSQTCERVAIACEPPAAANHSRLIASKHPDYPDRVVVEVENRYGTGWITNDTAFHSGITGNLCRSAVAHTMTPFSHQAVYGEPMPAGARGFSLPPLTRDAFGTDGPIMALGSLPSDTPYRAVIACNLTDWITRYVDSPGTAAMDPPLQRFPGDAVGVMDIVPEELPDLVGVGGSASIVKSDPLLRFRFTDEMALGVCGTAWTVADALYDIPSSTVVGHVGITNWQCDSVADAAHPYRCGFWYSPDKDTYSLAPSHAVGVRCSHTPTKCPILDNLMPLAGGYCSNEGQVLWLSRVGDDVNVNLINPRTLPSMQNHTEAATVRLQGRNCRLGTGESAQRVWAKIFNAPTDDSVVSVVVQRLFDEVLGADRTMLVVNRAWRLAPAVFRPCYSCPAVVPAASYCSTAPGDSTLLDLRNTPSGAVLLDVYLSRYATVPMCANRTTHVTAGPPTQQCLFTSPANGCTMAGGHSVFQFRADTLLAGPPELTTSRVSYKKCSRTVLKKCPAYLDESFCGVLSTNPELSLRFTFSKTGTEGNYKAGFVDVLMDNTEVGDPTVALQTPYRLVPTETACRIEMPVLYNYTGDLHGTSLFGRSQAPPEYDPTEDTIDLVQMDGTFRMTACPKCAPRPGADYCSLTGTAVIDFNADLTSYTLKPFSKAGVWPEMTGRVDSPAPQPCVSRLMMPDGKTQWKALHFVGSRADLKKAQAYNDVLDGPIEDTFVRCAQDSPAEVEFCTDSALLDYKIVVKDRMHMQLRPRGDWDVDEGPIIPYHMKVNELVNFSRGGAINATGDKNFNQISFAVYLGEDDGLMFLMGGAGYVNFPPCFALTWWRIALIAVMGVAVVSLLVIIFAKNASDIVTKLRSMGRKKAADEDAGDEMAMALVDTDGTVVQATPVDVPKTRPRSRTVDALMRSAKEKQDLVPVSKLTDKIRERAGTKKNEELDRSN